MHSTRAIAGAVRCAAVGCLGSTSPFNGTASEATLAAVPFIELQGMPSVMRLLSRGHDPYWGLEGKNVRRERRLRRLLELVVAFAIIALLLVVFKPLNTIGAIGELLRVSASTPPPGIVVMWPGGR